MEMMASIGSGFLIDQVMRLKSALDANSPQAVQTIRLMPMNAARPLSSEALTYAAGVLKGITLGDEHKAQFIQGYNLMLKLVQAHMGMQEELSDEEHQKIVDALHNLGKYLGMKTAPGAAVRGDYDSWPPEVAQTVAQQYRVSTPQMLMAFNHGFNEGVADRIVMGKGGDA